MKLTLGFSPCPNDTFIFDALVNGLVDTEGLSFDYVMEDVATLNKWAEEGKLDATKISYNTLLHTARNYFLLNSGSALGRGVGPLLIAKKDISLAQIAPLKIAIPGFNTTANLLLSLAFPEAKEKTALVFNEIEQAVIEEQFDAGLIIHENRFTYMQKGLVKLIDLGEWWEQTTGAAIPLGGIVSQRKHGAEIAAKLDRVLKKSIAYSWQHYPALSEFVTDNAQEMEEAVMRQHINLYVNEYTTDLGAEGKKAVAALFAKALAQNIVAKEEIPDSLFY